MSLNRVGPTASQLRYGSRRVDEEIFMRMCAMKNINGPSLSARMRQSSSLRANKMKVTLPPFRFPSES